MSLNNYLKHKINADAAFQKKLEKLADSLISSMDIEDIWMELRLHELFNNKNKGFLKADFEVGTSTEEDGYEIIDTDLKIDYNLIEHDNKLPDADDSFNIIIDGDKLQKLLSNAKGEKFITISIRYNESYWEDDDNDAN